MSSPATSTDGPPPTFNAIALSTTPPAQTPIDFLFRITILLLSLSALYVLFTIPRALARFSQPADLSAGFFLRAGPQAHPRRAASLGRQASGKSARTLDISDDSHTLNSHAALVTPARSSSRRHKTIRYQPPTRVPHYATLVHPLFAAAMSWRVLPHLTVRQVCVLAIYGGVWAYGGLYKSNPFSDPLRTGYLALSQLPIVVALACKNNILGTLAGLGYEKLNYIHRFTGRLLVIAVNVHGLGYLYSHGLASPPTLNSFLRTPHIAWGLVAMVAIDVMALTSLAPIRNRPGRLWYSLFLTTHVAGFLLFLLGVTLHTVPPTPHPSLIVPYLLTPLALYGLDHALRLVRMRRARAQLTPLPALNGGTTCALIPGLAAGWRAGQHVRVRLVGGTGGWWAAAGAWTMSRPRPFTIANAPGAPLELLVKSGGRGLWTGNLLALARGEDIWEFRGEGEKGRRSEKAKDQDREVESSLGLGAREVTLLVEGPYGGPNHALYASYSGALLVAGGSGISYVLATLSDLLEKHAAGRSRLRVIEVVWAVRDASSLTALLPALAPLLRPRPSPHAALQLRFTAYATRAPSAAAPPPLPHGVHLRTARPDLLDSLNGVIGSVVSAFAPRRGNRRSWVAGNGGGMEEWPSGVVVGVCGPGAMAGEVGDAVRGVEWGRWREVGGVEVVEEVFGW